MLPKSSELRTKSIFKTGMIPTQSLVQKVNPIVQQHQIVVAKF